MSRAQRFLDLMQAMAPACQTSFQRIYWLAPRGEESDIQRGDHVRLAMTEALIHPGVAYWVRINLSVRVMQKLAESTGFKEKAHQLAEVLEDFHVASDAFARACSIEEAQRLRRQRALSRKKPQEEGLLEELPENLGFSAEELALFHRFKREVIPGLVPRIRQRRAS